MRPRFAVGGYAASESSLALNICFVAARRELQGEEKGGLPCQLSGVGQIGRIGRIGQIGRIGRIERNIGSICLIRLICLGVHSCA